jgi:methionine-rich copper-binding protein CopC
MQKNRIYISIFLTSLLSFSGCGSSSGSNNKNSSGTFDQLELEQDTKYPSIKLLGNKDVYLTINEEVYKDEGAIAYDNQDGDLTSKIQVTSTVDFNQPGKYEITYQVSDKDGHVAIAKRKVYIQDFIASPTPREGLSINEVLTANTDTLIDQDFKDFSDWIELYNNSDSDMNIGGYYLSDDEKNPKKWRIPSIDITKNSYLLIWADGKDGGLHTNFNLGSSGGKLILSDRNGQKVDDIEYKKQKSDISCTKIGDKVYYMNPTPQKANKNAYSEVWKTKEPLFSQNGGSYSNSQKVTLTQKDGGTIYYTIDGSTPTINSNIYTQPIDINKTTIIRARSIEGKMFMSSVVNQTYLINENISLPIVSIGIDDKYLNDKDIGIYTNFTESWMRPASVEYIKNGESQFSENIGLRMFGNFTRTYAQKSLAVYAKDKYGNKSIKYPLFDQKPHIKRVKSFGLRVSGNDWGFTMMKDGLIQTIVKDTMDIDYQAYQPSVVFINGKYWGIQNIREKTNDDYLEANHGVDPKKIDILYNNMIVSKGSNKDYSELMTYVRDNNLSNDQVYQYVSSKVDVVEFMNLMITEIFVGNDDWPWNNMKYWKEQKEGSKWRWILFDLDQDFDDPNRDWFYRTLTTTNIKDNENPLWSTELFRNLMTNSQFKNEFLSRFTTYLNTTFKQDRMDTIITRLKNVIKPDIDRHFAKWPRRGGGDWENGSWGSIAELYEFSSMRGSVIRMQLSTYFNLSGNNILQIELPQDGDVYVDDVKLEEPFSGEYFTGMKVRIKAVPKVDYKFVGWSDGSTQNSREVVLDSNLDLTPIFESAPTPKIVINEFNYNSSKKLKMGDWIELYNNDSKDIDLSGWELKDAKQFGSFVVPSNTILKSGEYIVLTNRLVDFKTSYPDVNAIGDFSFGLGSEDSIRLFDKDSTLIDIVTYDETWVQANKNGNVLSLNSPDSDNSQSSNWSVVDFYGTPGSEN